MSIPPRDGEVEDTLATIVGCFSRYNNAMTEKSGAMSRNVGFIETLDCLLVSKLLEGPEWTHEILCDDQHKISYVVLRFMLRCIR